MNKAKIEACERLCREFLERAEAAKKSAYGAYGTIPASKESGALRRVSMELTRALAELRRPG